MDDPGQRRDGQWNLQIDRCRQNVDQHGPAGERPHRPNRHSPVESRDRFRLRSGPHYGPQTRAGRLPHYRRRSALGACALCRRKRGLLRPLYGSLTIRALYLRACGKWRCIPGANSAAAQAAESMFPTMAEPSGLASKNMVCLMARWGRSMSRLRQQIQIASSP